MSTLDRTTPPTPQPISNINLLKPEVGKLQNGLNVHVLRTTAQPVINLNLVFHAGRWFAEDATVSDYAAKMLAEGTHRHSAQEIAEWTASLGANLDVASGNDFFSIELFTLTKHLETLMPLIQQLIFEASFPEKELQTTKNRNIQAVKVSLEKTSYLASRAFRKNVFGYHHPYAYTPEIENIEKIDQEQLKDYYRSFIVNAPFDVFVTGDVGSQEIDILNKYLGSHVPRNVRFYFGGQCYTTPKPSPIYIEKENAMQTSIRFGKRIFKITHPDYPKFWLLNEILGGYFGSRLMQNLREDKGYTYGVSSGLVTLKNDGYFIVSTDVKKEHREQALQEIQQEITRMRNELVSEEELMTVKNYTAGNFLSSIATPFAVMDRYKAAVLAGLPTNFYDSFIAKVHQISAEELMQTAELYLDGDFVSIMAG